MTSSATAIALSIGLFIGMMVCLELGYRFGSRQAHLNPDAQEGISALDAAVFGLLGLLLGFAFAGAMSRLDARRQLIVREANAIGTAYLRVDLLPPANQSDMRHLFRDYIEARLGVYEARSDPTAFGQRVSQAKQLQQRIWAAAVEAVRVDQTQNTARVVLPALNEMIDVSTARMVALRTRMPVLIFALLMAVALLSGLVGGYAMARRKSHSVLHIVLFAAAVSITVYTVLDLDNPQSGLIRLDAADQVLRELRDSIRP